MLIRLALRLVLVAVVVGLVASHVPGIHVHGGFPALLWIAIIFTVVNAVVGPILRLLTFPLVILTLGLFLLILNAALLGITAWLSSDLSIDSFGAAVLGGFIIAVASWLGELLFPLRKRKKDRHHLA